MLLSNNSTGNYLSKAWYYVNVKGLPRYGCKPVSKRLVGFLEVPSHRRLPGYLDTVSLGLTRVVGQTKVTH